MRRTVAVLGVASVVTLIGGPPAQAITGDAAPDFEHPYVGVVVLYDANGAVAQACSGSLLTDTVFLTAGHCLPVGDESTLASSARVWFEQDAGAGYDPATGTPTSSGFPTGGGVPASTFLPYDAPGATYDAGMVILDQPVTDVYADLTEYASLADEGSLDEYVASGPAEITLSGYGSSNADGNTDELVDEFSRLTAETAIVGLDNEETGEQNALLAGSGEGGGGGVCFGDSGGPILVAGTDVTAGVISSGATTCTGPFLAARTDAAEVLAWILESAGDEAEEIQIVDVAAIAS
jgi:Trypsin